MNAAEDPLQTPAGRLAGAGALERYPNGALRGVILLERNEVSVPGLGTFTPSYRHGDARSKRAHSVFFYPSGRLKGLRLDRQAALRLPSVGAVPAEKLTFYESGAVKRVFPLDGRISGYWTERDERSLAEPLSLSLPCGEFSCLVSSLRFHESGAVSSVTLWPGENVEIAAGGRLYRVRIGFSLDEAGNLSSLEPARPTLVPTPLGELEAFDPEAVGIVADRNSLELDPSGGVTALKSLAVLEAAGPPLLRIAPLSGPHPLDDGRLRHFPLTFRFGEGSVKVSRDGTRPPEEWAFGPEAALAARPFARRPFARLFLGGAAAPVAPAAVAGP
ncbi:MAG: hypothetical protein LBW85_09230 [Deltaproteobacteria bacterium]|jgi:hypothetical protein|nr:hypothetical protein [Deltaproteobacteria bacterium]